MITITVLKILKSVTFARKMHLSNSTKEIESKDVARFEPTTEKCIYQFPQKREKKRKDGARFEPTTNSLLVYSSPDYATRKVIKYGTNKTY